jgi:hypothetical protein
MSGSKQLRGAADSFSQASRPEQSSPAPAGEELLRSPRGLTASARMTTNILLTGSSRGIGAAIATALSGPDISLIGHGTTSGIPPISPILRPRTRSGRRRSMRLDGRIDVLINNAGIFEANPIDLAHEEWVRTGSGRCAST